MSDRLQSFTSNDPELDSCISNSYKLLELIEQDSDKEEELEEEPLSIPEPNLKENEDKSRSPTPLKEYTKSVDLSNGEEARDKPWSPKASSKISVKSPVKTPIKPDSPALFGPDYKKKRLNSNHSPATVNSEATGSPIVVKEELFYSSPVKAKVEPMKSPPRNPRPLHDKPNEEFQFAIPSIPRYKKSTLFSKPPIDLRKAPQEKDTVIMNSVEYLILKEVGKGSSGKVFQVFSKKDKQFYALKWIEIKRESDTQAIENEIELLRSLKDQTRIVAILDYVSTPTSITIIMEFGEIDLAHLIQKQLKRPWDSTFIRHYWRQMLECVNTIHHKNILHSDLKPANFVLVKGRLKLIDFGIAKEVGDDTTNIYRGIQVGTVNYMAPEALLDINEGKDDMESMMKLGRASDVWALGCILYQMVYGKTPFYHLQLQQKLICIPNPGYAIEYPEIVKNAGDPEPVNIPKQLIKILQTCLKRDPTLRPPLTELLSHPFVNGF